MNFLVAEQQMRIIIHSRYQHSFVPMIWEFEAQSPCVGADWVRSSQWTDLCIYAVSFTRQGLWFMYPQLSGSYKASLVRGRFCGLVSMAWSRGP